MSLFARELFDPYELSFDPMRDIRKLQRDLNKMLEGPTRGEGTQELGAWMPRTDIKETGDQIQLHLELPGVKKEDINLELNNGVLTISGEKRDEKKQESDKFFRVERTFGRFVRSIPVPQGITEEQIKAKFDNGVLSVCYPKLETGAKSRKIAIDAGTQQPLLTETGKGEGRVETTKKEARK